MRSPNGHVVLITGASSGIGAALARECADEGASVVLTARRLPRLEALAADIEARGRSALAIRCDVTSPGDCEQAVARTIERFGRLNIVIANAGFGVAGDFLDLCETDYRRQFETNVFGVLRTLYAAVPELKKTGGHIVIMSSVSGYIPAPGVSPYTMSKFALQALAGSLYYEMAAFGISVTSVCPGFVESEIRRVDNEGRFHPEAQEPIPSWLMMSAGAAARHIVVAILKRKPEAIITTHGRLFVWVQRHAPWLIRFILRRAKRRSYRDWSARAAAPTDTSSSP